MRYVYWNPLNASTLVEASESYVPVNFHLYASDCMSLWDITETVDWLMEEPIILDKEYTLKLDDIFDKDWEERHLACNFIWESSDRDVEFEFEDRELKVKWTRGEGTFSVALAAGNCYG